MIVCSNLYLKRFGILSQSMLDVYSCSYDYQFYLVFCLCRLTLNYKSAVPSIQLLAGEEDVLPSPRKRKVESEVPAREKRMLLRTALVEP